MPARPVINFNVAARQRLQSAPTGVNCSPAVLFLIGSASNMVPGNLRADVMVRNIIRQWKMDPPHASQISLGGRFRGSERLISVMDSEVG